MGNFASTPAYDITITLFWEMWLGYGVKWEWGENNRRGCFFPFFLPFPDYLGLGEEGRVAGRLQSVFLTTITDKTILYLDSRPNWSLHVARSFRPDHGRDGHL